MAGVRPTHYDYYGWNEKWSLVGDFGKGVFLEPFEYIVPDNENTNCGYYIFDGEKYFIGTNIPVSIVSTESYTDVCQISLKAFAAAFEGLEVVVDEVRVGDVVFTPTNVKLDYDPQMLGEEPATEEALTFMGNASGKVSITMSVSGEVAGAPIVSLYSISVTHYAPNEARNLVYSASEATAVLGEEFTAPVLSGATQNVEYTSSNPYIAMVKGDGTVVPLSSGEAVITARGPEDNMYHAEEASYNLTVKYTSTTEGTSDTVQVNEAGGLRLAIADLESTRIRELTIRGKLNAADIKYLHEALGRLANLESLDLSGVELIPSDEPYATNVIMYKNPDLYASYSYYSFYISDTTYVNYDGSELNGLGGASGYYSSYGKGLGGAFAGMGIKRVVLPSSLTEIGELAFKDCKNLVEVVVPSEVSSMKEKAFWGCTSLPTVNITEKMKVIPENLFLSCSSLVNVGDLGHITQLGASAFAGCASLVGDAKNMILKINSLDTIPESSFDGCTELSDVYFSDNLSYIGKYAFRSCEELTSLTFPNTLKHIDYGAFNGCIALEFFNNPVALERVSADAFAETLWFENFIKNGNNEILYLGKVALAYVFDESYTDIELDFKEGTTCIADGFRCNIDNGSYISSEASKGRIKKITLPSSLRRIGDYAFGTELNGLKYNANITDIVLPENLEEIGDYAFSRCELLKAIEFPASLKHIGTNAFAYCKSISVLDLPFTIKTIGTYAFQYCNSLVKVRYDVPNAKGTSLFYRGGREGCTADKVIIGPNVEVLPDNIFSCATNLVKVEFEERNSASHLYVGRNAFSDCTNLVKLDLPLGTDSIGENAFYGCKTLQHIGFAPGLLKIGRWAFGGCSVLSSLELPEGLLYIDEIAFEDCPELKSVVFPESLQYIGIQVFGGGNYCSLTSVVWNPIYCTTERKSFSLFGNNITSLEIGDKVENIPSGFCSGFPIVSIDLPASLRNIEEYAFYHCYSLNKINLYATTPPTFVANNNTFANYNAEVHIPQGTLADYQATDWSKFNLIEDLPGTTIEKVSMNDIYISVKDGMLHVTGHTGNYSIYNIQGKLLYEGNATSTPLPAGIYIVAIEGAEAKVIL